MKNKEVPTSKTKLLEEIKELRFQNQHLQQRIEDQDDYFQKKYEAANKTKSRFLANISQEIRTPLSSIIGFAQIIQRDMRFGIIEQTSEYQKLLDNIENSGQYLSEIINSIIDISDIENGELLYQESDINIFNFFKNIFYVNKIEALKKNINLKYDKVSTDFPEYIRSDRKKLEKILNSIIDNAIKFTPSGKTVTLNLSHKNNHIIFEISDEGIGISKTHLKTIFKPFEKLNKNNAQPFNGIGLGLSVAKKIAQLLKGSIEVNSEIDQGSVFILKLPLVQSSKTIRDTPSNQEELIFSESSKILVVEDNLITQELITKIFSIFGLNVQIANNGEECLELAPKLKPDLILMDIYMPVMDGLKATIEIRKMPFIQKVPIIGLSAGATEFEQKKAYEAGMNDYLVKPINLDALLPILGQYLKTEKRLLDGSIKQEQQKERLFQHTTRLQANRYLQERQVEERTNALLKAKNQAEAANRSKSEFLANISHELKTPMHQILSFAKFGVDKFENVEREKLFYYFQKIGAAGTNLMSLLNDLLDLSKLEAGKADCEMLPCDLKCIIKKVSKEFDRMILEKNIRLEIAFNHIRTEAECDKYKIAQVIRNILSNAIKFTPNGEKVTVILESGHFKIETQKGVSSKIAAVIISVKDRGVGIPDDELTSIFDKFIQSSKTRTGAGGIGLGLAICLEIIKIHQGKIWAKNNPDGGSTFSFMIPYDQSPI